MKTAGRNTALIVAASLATAASAQSASGIIGDLSNTCQAAATGLVTSPFAKCANVGGLISVVTATGSVVDPINSWASGLCSSAACNQSDIDSAAQSIESGCSSDIADSNPAAIALDTIVKNYTQVRDGLCLQSSSNSTFCITNLLTGIQNGTGKELTIQNVESMLSSVSSVKSILSSLSPSVYCTDCTHGLLSKLDPILNSTEKSDLDNLADQQCGSSFSDGTVPSDLKEASSDSGASRTVLSAGVAALGLVGAFVLA